jgi:signal transduction histidine kinase
MERASEELIRAALHDLANTLSGIQGILDLSDPSRPLSPRDRDRLAAVLSEGQVTLGRARSLAMESLPAEGREAGAEWTRLLQEQLAPLGTLFRSRVEVTCAALEMPGPRLRGFIHAMARLLLPYAAEQGLKVDAEAGPAGWTVRFEPVAALPESLSPDGTAPRDIASRWARHLADSLAVRYELGDGVLRVLGPAR